MLLSRLKTMLESKDFLDHCPVGVFSSAMHDYDFNKLNDKEFEAFSVDLLGEHLKSRIERFKAGKDLGVDGRYFISRKQEAIIQCKHWAKSGVDALIRQLKKEESPKLNRLNPARYFLVTSLPLSRTNKADIGKALSPWLQSESDIFGQEDLNAILSGYPKVEERHHKLWFSSVTIMSRLQNASIKGRSDFEVLEAKAFAPKYIFTSCHNEAIEKLDKLGAIIITGEPGIGKSTLAKQIVLQYALEGYEVCCIAKNPEEAENLWQEGIPQVFYFDDFLGRNYLDALNRHEDSHIIGFIKRVRSDTSKRFILTSRTTVLNRGKLLTELFKIENLNHNEHELTINQLSLIDKARILYNHIWSSNLPKAYIDSIYKDERYLTIAEHQNYNPRLISFITDFNRLKDISSNQYWSYIKDTLENPRGVWEHVFDNQLDQHSSLLVRLTVLNGRDISESDLERAFYNYNLAQGEMGSQRDKFGLAVRLAVGSVLNRHAREVNTSIWYSLFNPSVGDYIISHYGGDQIEILACLQALQTNTSLSNLRALLQAGIVSITVYNYVVEAAALTLLNSASVPLTYQIHLAELYSTIATGIGNITDELKKFLVFLVEQTDDSEECGIQADLLAIGVNYSVFDDFSELLLLKTNALINDSWSDDDFQSISNLLGCFSKREIEELSDKLASQFVEYWKDNISTTVYQESVLDNYLHLDELEDARNALRDYVQNKASDIEAIVDYVDLDSIVDRIDIQEVITTNSERRIRDFKGPQIKENKKGNVDDEVAAVHDLFERSH